MGCLISLQIENKSLMNMHKAKVNSEVFYKTITVLILGSSGHGKTTLINIFNCGVTKKLYDISTPDMVPEITYNYAVNAVEETSLTSRFKNYQIKDEENHIIYNVIDSPGIGNAEGIEADDRNIKEILQFMMKIQQINSIILTFKSTELSFVKNFEVLIKRIVQIIPRDHLVNIMIALTFSDRCDSIAKNDIINLLVASIGEDARKFRVFQFNNAFFSNGENISESQSTTVLKDMYEESVDTINEICSFMKTIKPLNPSLMYCELINAVADAKSLVTQTQNEYMSLIEEKERLEEISTIIAGSDTYYSNFKDFTYTLNEYELEDCAFHNTICTGCFVVRNSSICHENCGLQYSGNTDANHFSGCACMDSSGRCRKCGCGPETHQHIKKKPIVKIITKTLYNRDIKGLNLSETDIEVKKKEIQEQIRQRVSYLSYELNITKKTMESIICKIRTKFPNYSIQDQLKSSLKNFELQLTVETDPIKRNKLSKAHELVKSAVDSLFSLA